MTHSRLVTKRALKICDLHPELNLNRRFVEEAAMLHDIGIIKCNAPGIYCFGSEPYLIHGRVGAEMMRAEGYPDHARVCERHTGAGIGKEEIKRLELPLPYEDFLPETMEEKVICYADKFYSKTHPEVDKSISKAENKKLKAKNIKLKSYYYLCRLNEEIFVYSNSVARCHVCYGGF